jgi:methylated-DNA-[protein]-cysteine S-methyltransferase
MMELRCHFITTRFGPLGILWREADPRPLVRRVVLSRPGKTARDTISAIFPGCSKGTSGSIMDLARDMEAFLHGTDISFPMDRIDILSCPPFQQDVLRAEHAIPRGSVSTYSRIAGHLGRPRAARAVGTSLARNPFPILVPCHRAIRSDGFLGGFQGGTAMKQSLLEMEGMVFDSFRRVHPIRFWYGADALPETVPSRTEDQKIGSKQ